MRKIAFMSGGCGPLSPELRRRHAILQGAASTGTQVDMYGGKGSIQSTEDVTNDTEQIGVTESEYALVHDIPNDIRVAVDAEEEGYNAVILSCGADPGLSAIREAVSIPVVGPGTAARHVCSLICHRFTLLTTGKRGSVKVLSDDEVPSGLGRWSSTRRIGLGVLEVRERPEEAFTATLREAKAAMTEDGSDAFTYGCMSMAFLDMDKKLEKELGVPFVNPAKVAVRIAEMYVDLGIRHSKLTFPSPFKR